MASTRKLRNEDIHYLKRGDRLVVCSPGPYPFSEGESVVFCHVGNVGKDGDTQCVVVKSIEWGESYSMYVWRFSKPADWWDIWVGEYFS